jgi:hypothetical protein
MGDKAAAPVGRCIRRSNNVAANCNGYIPSVTSIRNGYIPSVTRIHQDSVTRIRSPGFVRGLRPVCSTMHSTMEFDKSSLQVLLILLPTHSIYSRRCAPL